MEPEASPETRLVALARRRYERGRLRQAVRSALWVLPATGLSLLGCGQAGFTLCCGCLLFLLLVGLAWRGQQYRSAITPGLLGGSIPLVLPLLACGAGCVRQGWCNAVLAACTLGGVLAAGVVGLEVARSPRWSGLLPLCLLVAGLTGALGCVFAGLAGVGGMLLGMLAGAAPSYLTARR